MLLFPKFPKSLFLLLIYLLSSHLFSQFNYSKSDSNYYQSVFYKQLTTWSWQSNINLSYIQLNHWNWSLKEQYHSSLLTPAEGQEQWKDENNARGILFYNKPAWDYGFYLRSWYQNDEQSSSDNEFGNQVLGLFSTYRHHKSLKFTPYAGMQQSKNRKYVDWGLDIGLEGKVNRFKLGDYHLSTQFDSDFDLYDKRQNFANDIYFGASTNFNEYTGDSLAISFSINQKQYYDNNPNQKKIIDVNIVDRNIRNFLFYNLSPVNRILLVTQLKSIQLDFVADRKIFLIDNELKFNHFGSKLFYYLSLRTNDQTQDNSNIITNNRTRQTIMTFESDYRIDARKKIEFDMTYSKFQYDTPEKNTEDRDEQRFIIDLGYDQILSEYLSMKWTLYTYFFHKIYLSSEQSQNNNWNRIIALNPKINYQYGRIRNRFDTEILANYTVYDFEELFTKTRSYVFRKYSLSDSLIYQIYGKINGGFYTRIELEDKGHFFQTQWQQQIVQSYHSDFYNIFIENENFIGFNFRFGYTYYDRIEWRHLPKKQRNRIIINKGPYISIRFHITNRIYFAVYASLSNLDDSAIGATNYSSGKLRLDYFF
ncbi:MAG TPA: hypothetical protein ENO18_00920 [Caldithrix sp.]|nr:hypothetical protein [Caldithrix sp.]